MNLNDDDQGLAMLFVVLREVISLLPEESRGKAHLAFNRAVAHLRESRRGSPALKMVPLMNDDSEFPWPWMLPAEQKQTKRKKAKHKKTSRRKK